MTSFLRNVNAIRTTGESVRSTKLNYSCQFQCNQFLQSQSRARNLNMSTRCNPLDEYTPTIADLPKPQQVKIALCQLMVTQNKEGNIKGAVNAIKNAGQKGAKLVVLPEMWNCPYANESFSPYAEDIDSGNSESIAAIQQAAKEANVTLVGGSIPERSADRLYNTCCVIGPDGQMLAKHRKTHLFDVDIPGKVRFRESDTLTAGENLTVVDTEAGRLGIGVCYDLRFPEMAAVYARRGVQIIIYPGAFNMTSGPVHWRLLVQARAVDNQLFVATCSPARNEQASYVAWGHSCIAGPFGEMLGETNHLPSTVTATLDYGAIEKTRTNMPFIAQRRNDLYVIVDKDDLKNKKE